MRRRPDDSRISERAYLWVCGMAGLSLILMGCYLTARVLAVISGSGYTAADRVMAILLLGAELFVGMHAVAHYFNFFKCGRRQATLRPIVFARHHNATVALIVAAYNESEAVLEGTLAAARALDYPVTMYLLDDSTRPECREGAARVARKYGATLVQRTTRAGYKAGAINDLMPRLTEQYIALLDADQLPETSWITEMVAMMEERPKLALVQTPQHYINDLDLPVCAGARYQQGVFYEYICEGKAYSNAMFCCGSNVILRREALLSIEEVRNGRRQFFDERSVTEDFATTFLLHLKGWESDYVNHSYAVGMGPETLPAYFIQQGRWALGTQAMVWPIVKQLFTTPRAMTPGQWWEYWIVATYYFVGYSYFIFLLAPVAYMLFDVRPLRTDSILYLMFFVPFIISTMTLSLGGMRLRHYPIKGIWLAGALNFSTFWIFVKSGAVALLRLKRPFGVTPKGFGGAIPVRRLWMELTMMIASLVVAAWCLYHIVRGEGNLAYAINGVWSTYHAVLLSTLFFHFNKPVSLHARKSLFEPAADAA